MSNTQNGLIGRSSSLAPQLLDTGLDFIADLYNTYTQNQINQREIDYSREAATTAYERQLAMIADQRRYDSVQAQMNRFMEAGLNPNLIYGGIQAPQSPASAPQAETPSLRHYDVSNPFDPLLKAQIDNLNSQTKKNLEESRLPDAQIKDILKGIDYKDSLIGEINAHVDFMQHQAANLDEQARLFAAENSYYQQSAVEKRWDALFKEMTLDSRVKQLASEANISETRARYEAQAIAASLLKDKAMADYYFQKAGTESYQRTYLDSLSASTLANGSLAIAQRDYYNQLEKYYPDKTKQEIATMAAQEFNYYSNTVQGIVNDILEFTFPSHEMKETTRGGVPHRTKTSRGRFKRLIFRR